MESTFFSPNLVRAIKSTSTAAGIQKLSEKRGTMLREALAITSDGSSSANLGAALRMVMLADQDLFEDVAYLQKAKGCDVMQRSYDTLASLDKNNKSSFQRATAIDAAAGAGNDNFATLFVEKTIQKRVEAESDLIKFLTKKKLTSTNNKFPKGANLAKSLFAAKSADLVDLTNTIDVGYGDVQLESQKFGSTMFLEAEAFVKLDATIISEIIDDLTAAHRRGLIDQIINGNGTPPNATGLATNATAIAFNGNITQTLITMMAATADVTLGKTDQIFILTNTAATINLHGEKFINLSHKDLIDALGTANGNGNFLQRIPIIEEDVIVTSGSSPNKTAPLYVGKDGDYLYGVQTDPEIMIDKYSDFKAGGETVRIMNFWNGIPYFNDSFTKTTIPSLY